MSRRKRRRNRQQNNGVAGGAAPSVTAGDSREERLAKSYFGRLRAALHPSTPGGWASDHYEETLHYTEWNYVASHALALQCSAATVEVSRSISRGADEWTGKSRRKSHDQASLGERDVLPDDFPLCVFLNQPNPNQSGALQRYEQSVQLSLTGTAMVVKVRNAFGKTVESYVIPTCLMMPRMPDARFPLGAYVVSPAATRTNWADDSFVEMVGYQRLAGTTIDARDVIKTSLPHPLWKDEGYSPLSAGSLWTDGAESISQSRLMHFRNGPDPSFYLEPPPDVNPSDAEIERVLEIMLTKYSGTRNVGKVFVGPGGTKLTPLSTTPKEMAYTEGFDQSQKAIMGLHGVTPIAAGILDGGSYAAFYAALTAFVTLTVQPRLNWLAASYQMHVGPEYGDGLTIRFLAQSITDPAVLESRLGTDITARSITKNEIRELRGLPPRSDGDVWVGDTQRETVSVDPATAPDAAARIVGDDAPNKTSATDGDKKPSVKDVVDQSQATIAQAAKAIGEAIAKSLKDWDESKHPRGQPGNAGQFGPGGESGADKKPAKKPDKFPDDEVERSSGNETVSQYTTYDSNGRAQTNYVGVAIGTHGPDGSNDPADFTPVHRWEATSSDGREIAHGNWTDSRGEAERGARDHAAANHEKEPEHAPAAEEDGEPDEGKEPQEYDGPLKLGGEAEMPRSKEQKAKEEADKSFGDKSEKFFSDVSGLEEPPEGKMAVSVSPVKKWTATYTDDVPVNAVGRDISIKHPYLKQYKGFVGVDENGKKMMQIKIVEVKRPPAPKGFGATMFARQVAEAEKDGTDYITLHAAGNRHEKMNGYYTWPAFGFDCPVTELSKPLQRTIAKTYPQAKSVQDIFAVKGGREWWHENGGEMLRATFDTKPGSRSRQIFDRYLEEKKKLQTTEAA